MTKVITTLPYVFRDFPFHKGLIVGLQSQELYDTPCLTGLDTLQTTWVSSSYQLDFVKYATSVLNKGNTPTDTGFAISLYEFVIDISLVFFNFYSACQFELLLINLGSYFSKTSSAFNFSNSIGYVMYQWFQEETDSPIYALNSATYNYDPSTAGEKEKELVGFTLGAVIKQITSFNIPVYEVNAFGSVEQTKTV